MHKWTFSPPVKKQQGSMTTECHVCMRIHRNRLLIIMTKQQEMMTMATTDCHMGRMFCILDIQLHDCFMQGTMKESYQNYLTIVKNAGISHTKNFSHMHWCHDHMLCQKYNRIWCIYKSAYRVCHGFPMGGPGFSLYPYHHLHTCQWLQKNGTPMNKRYGQE